jgi:hypothetical protein
VPGSEINVTDFEPKSMPPGDTEKVSCYMEFGVAFKQIRCRFATPKSVSFCGEFGTTFEYNSVSFYGARGPRARVQVPLRAGRFCRVEIDFPRCSAARYLHDEAFQKPASI